MKKLSFKSMFIVLVTLLLSFSGNANAQTSYYNQLSVGGLNYSLSYETFEISYKLNYWNVNETQIGEYRIWPATYEFGEIMPSYTASEFYELPITHLITSYILVFRSKTNGARYECAVPANTDISIQIVRNANGTINIKYIK